MFFAVLKKKRLIALLCPVVAVVLGCFGVFNKNLQTAFGKVKTLPIYRVERGDKKISISFDCAWGVDYTDKLLSVMEEEKVKCTFFAVEFWTTKHPDYIKKIASLGHDIGTH